LFGTKIAFIRFAEFTASLSSVEDHPVDNKFPPPPLPFLVSGKKYNAQKVFPGSIVIGSSDAS
jgi:hypothetical protein